MDVQFVYFDLDDTLLDHAQAEREALADVRNRYLEVFGTLSVDELQEVYHAINSPLWRRYADGEIDKATVQNRRFEQLVAEVGAGHANAGLIGRYYMERYAEHWQFVDGARAAYERVADRYPVGVLTNGFAEVQSQKLERFPVIRDRAETVVVSEEVGVMKPDPDIFAHATERAGVDPGAVLYVGDSYRSDVEGGQQFGWRVAWFARTGTGDRTTDDRGFVFDDWAELEDRILEPA
jgi:HAD superfamily hydrolase (TIGR01549 family)